jgi:hypothetical protein
MGKDLSLPGVATDVIRQDQVRLIETSKFNKGNSREAAVMSTDE